MIPAMEYNPIFFAAIVETLFEVTNPDSSIQKPAAIHITRKPHIKKSKLFKIYAVSSETSALAINEKKTVPKKAVINNNFSLDI